MSFWRKFIAPRRITVAVADKTRRAASPNIAAKIVTKTHFAFTADHGLAALGLAAAAGSASFAGYMMTTDNSHPRFGGAEHLMLFARPIRNVPVQVATAPKPADQAIDYTATATIPSGTAAQEPRASERKGPANKSETPDAQRLVPLKNYILRKVHDDVALVEGRNGSYEVEAGSLLPEAGWVVSIEKRGDKWVVVTSEGIIGDGRP